MTEPIDIKISEVVGAINFLVSAKIQSDLSLLDKEATESWVLQSGERHQQASIKCANTLEKYVAQAVQQELVEILQLTNQKIETRLDIGIATNSSAEAIAQKIQ